MDTAAGRESVSAQKRRRTSVASIASPAMIYTENIPTRATEPFSEPSEASPAVNFISNAASFPSSGPETSSPVPCQTSSLPSILLPTLSSNQTGAWPRLLAEPTNFPSYAYPYPPQSIPNSHSKFEHQASQSSGSHVYHYQSQTQYPPAYPIAFYQRRPQYRYPQLQGEHPNPRPCNILCSPPSDSCEPPDSGLKLQFSYTESCPLKAVPESISKSSCSLSPALQNQNQLLPCVIQRSANALLELFEHELMEAQSKHEVQLSTAASTHWTELSRLHAELARSKYEVTIKETEIENLNAAHASVLALKQHESDTLLLRTKRDMQATYKRQADSLEETLKVVYQEKLDRMAMRYREMIANAQTASEAVEKQAKEMLKEVEARLDHATKAFNEEIVQLKRDEEWSKRQNDVDEMRRLWEEERRRLEGCIEEEKKKRLEAEAAREKEREDEKTRKKVLEKLVKEKENKKVIAGFPGIVDSCSAYLNLSEVADALAVEQQLFTQAEAESDKSREEEDERDFENVAGDKEKMQTATAFHMPVDSRIDDVDASGVVEAVAKEQQIFARSEGTTGASEDVTTTAVKGKRKRGGHKALQKEREAILQQEAKLKEERKEHEEVKKRLEDWVEEMKSALLQQVDSERKRSEEDKRAWEQSMRVTVEKERKESETLGYQLAMRKVQGWIEDWKAAAAKQLQDAKEEMAKEKEVLAKEKERLAEERQQFEELKRSQEGWVARVHEADKARIQYLNEIWRRFVEADLKQKEEEQRRKAEETTQTDVDMESQ